jgi:ankyrin repeat protein
VNLEQLRKQAKELTRAARAGDDDALARLDGREPTLAHAQLALAREQGYPSWPALVAAAEADAESFVLAATGRQRTRAEAMLAARPEIADDPWAALVLGRAWRGDPGTPGGPRGWAPLLYVCHSSFPSATLARELLDRGADPNVTFENEYGHMSALYGAAGVAHDPELTRVLLEAGADPDDGESLYHATESPSTACLELLLAHGAMTSGTNALAHALDDERLEHVRLLLEAGADPNEHAHVAHAVRRGRGPEFVRLLAEHGADPARPGGETWRGNVPLRTPYQHARLRGRDDVADTLAELGASTAIDPADAAVESLARGERPTTPLPESFDVDQQEVIVLAALRGRLDAVVDAVGPGFRGVVGGSPEGSLVEHAAWVGDAVLVERLLGLGAEPGSALGWAAHGSGNHGAPGDYIAVAELLVAAGSPVEPGLLDDAAGPLYAWLDDRLPLRP